MLFCNGLEVLFLQVIIFALLKMIRCSFQSIRTALWQVFKCALLQAIRGTLSVSDNISSFKDE